MNIASSWLRNAANCFYGFLAIVLLTCLAWTLNIWGQTEAAHQPSLYRYTGNIQIDLHKMSFSSYGSYMAFSLFP